MTNGCAANDSTVATATSVGYHPPLRQPVHGECEQHPEIEAQHQGGQQLEIEAGRFRTTAAAINWNRCVPLGITPAPADPGSSGECPHGGRATVA